MATKHSYLKESNRQALAQDSFLIVNKKLYHILGHEAAIFLSDLISKERYFDEQGKLNEDRWFFNTQQNIWEDTALTPYQQRKAIKLLKSKELLQVRKEGLPARHHFRLNHKAINLLVTTPLNFKGVKPENLKDSNKNNIIKINNKFPINRKLGNSADAELCPPSASTVGMPKKTKEEKNTNPTNSNKTKLKRRYSSNGIPMKKKKHLPFTENKSKEDEDEKDNKNKTDYLKSYPYENVRSIFRYWCTRSPTLTKHSPTSKTALNALEAVNWALNNGATEREIKRSIDNYGYLLSTNTKVQTAVAAGKLGWRVGLNEFFSYSDFTTNLAKKKGIKLPVDSWFYECLQSREELISKYSCLVEDEVPSYTKQIKKFWNRIMRKDVVSPSEENSFRKAAKMLDDFVKRKGINGDKSFNLTHEDDMVRLLFEALEKDVRSNWAKVTPGWLCSKRTYSNRLPAYLIDLGYDYYSSYNDVDSVI